MHLKSIFQFDNYREYLEHFYEFKKSGLTGYSYREFATAAGLGSANYLKLVISGKKNLTISNIHQFANALNLSGSAYEYFEVLVLKNQAKGKLENSYYHKKLIQLKQNKPLTKATGSMREITSEWYYPAILVSLDGMAAENFDSFRISLSRRLSIPESKIRDIVDQFIKLKVVQIIDGLYRLEARHIHAYDSKSRDIAHKKFLESQLTISQNFLKTKYDQGAKFHSHTIKINKESFGLVNDKFKEFLSEITALSDTMVGDDIIQINTQILLF